MPDSLFRHLADRNAIIEVDSNGLDVWRLGSGKKVGIGTRVLNGDSCVVIIGKGSILLARILLLSGSYELWTEKTPLGIHAASQMHHRLFLHAIARHLQIRSEDFHPASTTVWGVFACKGLYPLHGEWRAAVEQIRKGLGMMGYSMKPVFYRQEKEIPPPPGLPPPKGELVALWRHGMGELYLERRRLWPPMMGTAAPQQADSAASESGYDGEDEEETDEEDETDGGGE